MVVHGGYGLDTLSCMRGSCAGPKPNASVHGHYNAGMAILLLAGATGLVGGHVLLQSLADARIARIVAPTRVALPPHPKLVNPIVDFECLPREAAWWQVDAVICALGTTIRQARSEAAFRKVDFDYVLDVARLARMHGATTFALTSSLGANAMSRNFYLRTKGETESALKDCGFASLTFVRPSMIGGERERTRPLEHFGMRTMRALEPLIPRRWRVVPAERIAHALIEAALAAAPGCTTIESETLQPGRAPA
jgi:uncharacterized protein YbjT (DUF2867 family)